MDEQKIRERAYALWEEAGRPEGQEQDFWDRARELVAQEDNLDMTIRNPLQAMTEPGPHEEPLEPAETTDQDNASPAARHRRSAKE